MKNAFVRLASVATLFAGTILSPSSLAAQSLDVQPEEDGAATASLVVELRSTDGFVSVHGVITNFDESLITIETSYGVVGLETFGVACFGAACPVELRAAQEDVLPDVKLSDSDY